MAAVLAITKTDQAMQISSDVVIGGIVTSVGGFFLWLIRVAFRQVMDRFDQTMKLHASAIADNTREVRELRQEITAQRIQMADFNARLKAVEGIGWEDGK